MPTREQPNILFIFTDQQKLPAVGCYGDTPCQTPNIDQLAARGTRFHTAYTACPVCTPSRATIMTGLYPHAHGMCCNVEDLGCSVHEIVDRPQLLSRRLQALGYRCGYTGKWHLGSDREVFYGEPNTPCLPRDVGFEGQQSPGHGNGGFLYPEYQRYLAENGWEHRVKPPDDRPFHAWKYGVVEGPTESTVPHFLADHTISLLDRYAETDEPFFIWHNFWGPHGPYYVSQEFYDIYRDVDIPEWPNYRWDARAINRPLQVKLHTHLDELSWDDWAEATRYYYAFATLIDRQIGRILERLEPLSLRDNTIVVFAADHGETLGSHGGLTDKGWHHFEEIQRIPFIVSLPERYQSDGYRLGQAREELVSLVDLYPTFLEMAGITADGSRLHGRSLMPLLCGDAGPWRERVFVEFFGVNSLSTTMASVREGRFKYGWNCSSYDDLYDLENDPHEMTNLVDDQDHAAILEHLREAMETWMVETDHPSLGYYRRTRRHKWPY